MFRLGVITDEIDADLERALAVARELGLREVELNGVWGSNIVQLSPGELDRVEALLQGAGVRVCALGTPAFKAVEVDLALQPEGHPGFVEHLAMVERGCDLARRFGAPYVRIFSLRKCGMQGLGNPSPRLSRGGPVPGETLAWIAGALRRAAEVAERAGVTLVVENVRSCWGNTCWNTARILEAAAHPRLKTVWDPGNDHVSGGDPFPEGYEAARPWIAHVHVKNAAVVDASTGLTRWERIGGGDLDYAPMLARLATDGYDGVVTLETHWRGENMSAEESTRASFADLKALLDASPPSG